jgi:hypothetical protein
LTVAFGTPTATVNGGLVDVNDRAWRHNVITAA